MKLTSYLILALAFVSCAEQESFDVTTNLLKRNKKNTTYDNVLDYVDFMKDEKGGSRSMDSYSVSPYLNKDGDTIAYVVDYSEGWDLLSSDRRTPLVLASSPEGTFNKEEIKETDNLGYYWDEMEGFLTELKATPMTETDSLGQGWNALYVRNGSVPEENIVKTKAAFEEAYPGDNGYWVLLESETEIVEEVPLQRAITTEWNQDINMYIPQKVNEKGDSVHCKVGCVAVAGGQYLYYLHNKKNNPRYMVNDVSYNNSTKKYTFTGSSELVWEYMDNPYYGIHYVGILLGYIASEIGTIFGIEKSFANENQLSDFMNNKYGYNQSWHSYSSSTIVGILEREGAVIAVADGYDDKGEFSSHAFLIDGYRTKRTKTTSTYGWVGEDNMGQDTNDRDDEGNIIGYAFMTTQVTENTTSTIYMNWGQLITSYNNIGFNTAVTNWTMGENYYNSNKYILY